MLVGRQPDNLLGNKYGELEVIEFDSIKGGNAVWKCLCSCGKERVSYAHNLKSGNIVRCKSCSRKITFLKTRIGEMPNWYWNKIKFAAIERGYNFNINCEQAWELFLKQDRRCALSNIMLNFPLTTKHPYLASLDRIDSDGHYDIENVQWVHKDINKMKTNLNQDHFIKMCKAVASSFPGV